MRPLILWVALGLFVALPLPEAGAASPLGVRFEGGTVLSYGTLDSQEPRESSAAIGNGAQLLLTVDVGAVELGLGLGVVLPGSDVAASLTAIQLLCQWHLWREETEVQEMRLSPYLSLGAGVANADSSRDEEDLPPPALRWVSSEPEPLVLWGLGATFGSMEGLYVSGEVRAVNLTHLGILMGVGTHF
jgi:hypothetical protein